MTLKLKVGKYYKRRDGKVVKICETIADALEDGDETTS